MSLVCRMCHGTRHCYTVRGKEACPTCAMPSPDVETAALLSRVQSTLCNVAQLIDGAIKDESWSEWDQSVRDAVTERMREIEARGRT